jgi:hypothetical protein
MTNKQKKEKKLTFLNHLLAPTFLAQNPKSERWDLLISIFILKMTGTFTPVHSAGYLILRNEFRSTQEVARRRIKYLKLKYGLLLLKIHEKYKKYIFCIIFYVSLIKNDKQTKKGKEINIFKYEFRSTQEVARQNIQVSFYIRSTGLLNT